MSSTLTLEDFHSIKDSNGIYSNAKTFAGKKVVDYDPSNSDDVVFRFRSDWDNNVCVEQLKKHIDSDRAGDTSAIVIGMWTEEMYETGPSEVLSLLVESKDALPNLKALYIGDVVSEENEMSWMVQTDLSPLVNNFPKLEYLRSRGSNGLAFSTLHSESLRALTVETGGLDVSVLRSISMASLPELEHLELWLGTAEYEGNCTVEDLQPIFSGEVFPKLKYLGLRNYDQIDAVCSVLVNSPIIEQLEVLDLSLGILTDIGAHALLRIPANTSVKRLILNHHFITDQYVTDLKKLPFSVEVGDVQEDDDGWRFVAVGE